MADPIKTKIDELLENEATPSGAAQEDTLIKGNNKRVEGQIKATLGHSFSVSNILFSGGAGYLPPIVTVVGTADEIGIKELVQASSRLARKFHSEVTVKFVDGKLALEFMMSRFVG